MSVANLKTFVKPGVTEVPVGGGMLYVDADGLVNVDPQIYVTLDPNTTSIPHVPAVPTIQQVVDALKVWGLVIQP
jgi:hypothetical protein